MKGTYERALLFILSHKNTPLKRTSLVNSPLIRMTAYIWARKAGQVADDLIAYQRKALLGDF